MALTRHTRSPGSCTAHLDSLVVISRHLLEELGSVDVRCVADDARYTDVEIEAKGVVGEAVYVNLSSRI